MDQSYQFYLFILSTTILFIDTKSTDGVSLHDWFDAQEHCLGQGLTVERDKSDEPYWTGVYRRLTPWINILGCYPNSTETLKDVIEKTLIFSSIVMCQDICRRENIYQFAVKMNKCLCIKHDIRSIPISRLSPLDCNYKCENNTDGVYSADCGGEDAYNIYETQGVMFDSKERCLSLHCFAENKRFIPQKCSIDLDGVCANKKKPDKGYANNWIRSMEQCKNSQKPVYLLGDVNLHNPHLACTLLTSDLHFVWIGIARKKYTSFDQGWTIEPIQRESFLQCQVCGKNDCKFRRCFDMINSSIFCKNISDESKGETTSKETVSASTLMSSHSTSDEILALTSTAGYYDTDQLPSTNDTQQMSSVSDELALKISLPVMMVFIILLLCATVVVFYIRRRRITKADRTTKAQVKSGPRQNDSNVDCVQNNSYFVLEQCPQYISKGSYSSKESPYNNSEEGVYDHLRDKISRTPEVEDTYQHASAGVSRDMSEYDTMANAVNKKQEDCDSDDYSHQDSNGNYACDLRAKNNLTDNPYDVAV